MKKMLVVSLVLGAALAVGCSKKNPQTTPTGGAASDMKKDGDPAGGATYGGPAAPDGSGAAAPADPCAPQ